MINRRLITDESGLTLIELVVVAALAAVLSTILYGVLSSLLKARDATEKIRDAETTAHYLFVRMTKELSSTSRSLTPLSLRKQNNQQVASGAALYLEGTNKEAGEYARDSIRFVSTNAAQPFVDGPANYGTVEVSYSLQNASDEEAMIAGVSANENKGDSRTMVFVREEVPASVQLESTRLKRRIVLPLASNVVSMDFRYLLDGKWRNEWKDINPALPEAMEITLGLVETDGKVEYYRTALALAPRARRRGSSTGGGGTGGG